jgi:predicted metal-dependent hydrolase
MIPSFPRLPDHVVLDNIRVPLKISRHHNARRMTLRYDLQRRQVKLTLPPRAPARLALAFLAEKQEWLVRQVQSAAACKPFSEGMELPVFGQNYILRHRPAIRGGVELQAPFLTVTCLPEHLPRRLTDWLKHSVRERLVAEAKPMAKALGVTFKQIRVREMSSRWGSCSATGNLSFNWRLVFAPASVLTYLVAHEVAHLKEMNHSPAFWTAVAKINPDYQKARGWLQRHGNELHRYGG